MNKNISEWLPRIVIGGGYLITVFLLAKFGLMGLNSSHKFFNIVPVFIFLCFFIPEKITFWCVVFPLSVLICLFSPVSYVYGNIDYQVLISIIATNVDEASEFLLQVPIKVYLKSVLVPALALLSYFVSKKIVIRPWNKKALVFISVGVLTVCVKPTDFFYNFFSVYKETNNNLDELKKYVNSSSWTNVVLDGGEKDYVIILGESARKDYFHLYGYPIANTPFLDKVSGISVVDGFTSGGVYTVGSLTNMLTDGEKISWKPRYDRNLIDLANSAGIKTYWLSNQGYIGVFDTPVTAIANRAQDKVFLCKQKNASKNISDLSLLPVFQEKLNNDVKGKRLFVLHTIGSHPDACRRVLDLKNSFKSRDYYFEYVACYISSIKKADFFISKVYDVLSRHKVSTGREFSIIYVSDHGQMHSESGGRLKLHNNAISKFHYDVPLVKIDSQGEGRLFIESEKSGLNFTAGIASWLGIEAEGQLEKYDLFDGVSDQSDFGLKNRIERINSEPDPAVVVPLK